MFDQIGRVKDDEAGRRRAAATLITALLVGGTSAFLFAATAWTAHEVLTDTSIKDTPITLLLEDEPPPPPELPPEPVRRGGGKQVQKGTPDAPPETAPAPSPAPLQPLTKTELVDKDVRGRKDGEGDDEVNIDAPPGTGVPSGEGSGHGAGDVHVVHHTELVLRRRPDPVHPEAGAGEQVCHAQVRISAEGRPASVQISGCDEAYAQAARKALMRWRWSRPRVGGKIGAALTTYRIVFKDET